MLKKTLDSLIKKVSKIDPLRADYLKRHVKYDRATDSLIYTGDKKIINSILRLVVKLEKRKN